MYESVSKLATESSFALVISDGFEERTPEGLRECVRAELEPALVVILCYDGDQHAENNQTVLDLSMSFANDPEVILENVADDSRIDAVIGAIPRGTLVIYDITGLSRTLILHLLSLSWKHGHKLAFIYTEADEYFPIEEEFKTYLEAEEDSLAFEELIKYEKSDVVYSSQCITEDIASLPGRFQPGLPLLIVSFLTFKRSRLARVLRDYECNRRVLIKGVPVRADLAWRDRSLEIINFDLIDSAAESVFATSTLDWKATYRLIEEIYTADNTQFRYNVLLAPLGGKIQTVAAWYFAIKNRSVKVITSTPKEHFSQKYSRGIGQCFLIRLGDG